MNGKEKQSSTLQAEYRQRFSELKAYREAVWKVLVKHYFQPMIPESSEILDLGCGWGEFINHIRGSQRYAIDLNPDSRAMLDPEVTFFHQDCSQTWPLEDESLDVVFTSNFLEHLPDKPHVDQTLRQARRCLRPGGMIICLGPNVKYVPGAYWDFWDHYVPISDASMAEALQLAGFEVRKKIGRFLPYSMSDKPPPPLFLVRLYLKISLAWPIFGKQFLVTAARRS